jgi:hypothetical protein
MIAGSHGEESSTVSFFGFGHAKITRGKKRPTPPASFLFVFFLSSSSTLHHHHLTSKLFCWSQSANNLPNLTTRHHASRKVNRRACHGLGNQEESP